MKKSHIVALTLATCLFGASPISSLAQTTQHSVASSNQNQKITMKKAKKIAVEKVGGGKVVHSKKDDQNTTYEITVKKDNTYYEVEIDAKTGKVLEMENESGSKMPSKK